MQLKMISPTDIALDQVGDESLFNLRQIDKFGVNILSEHFFVIQKLNYNKQTIIFIIQMLKKIRKGDMSIPIDNERDDDIVIDSIDVQKKDLHKYEQNDNIDDMEDVDYDNENDIAYLEQEMDEL
jgi:hypothetical protein